MPRSIKPSHWAIVDRTTGEHHFAIGMGRERPSGYDEAIVDFVRLPRAPQEHDKFVGRRLIRCTETQAEIERCARFNAMSRAELVAAILWLVDERIARITTTTTQEEI